MEFYKNQLIDEVLLNYYSTFERTLDTCDYVPKKYNDKILKYIFKNMKKKFKQIDKEYKVYLKQLKKLPLISTVDKESDYKD